MKTMLFFFIAAGLMAAGVAGRWFGLDPFRPDAIWFLAGGVILMAYVGLRTTYYRSGTDWTTVIKDPQRIDLKWWDYLKAAVCWLDAFTRTYAVQPGLYYTGRQHDHRTPLLVTANYFLTVFLLIRRIRAFNARLLVIDTDGINVWCAAGKEKFSNSEILKQLNRYDRQLLTADQRLTLIVPKLAFAGVNLKKLRQVGVHPVIGPIYAKDLPDYLRQPPYKNRDKDRVLFGLQSRVFTWLPGLVQVFTYGFAMVLALWGVEQIWGLAVPTGILILAGVVATGYPILFPWIPSRRFAVKGIWLAAVMALVIGVLTAAAVRPLADLPMTLLFTFGTAIFFGLSYSGNSAVSNYSRVRKEIAQFFPVYVFLYTASLAAFVITEVYR